LNRAFVPKAEYSDIVPGHSAGTSARFCVWIYLPGPWIHNQDNEYWACTSTVAHKSG